MMMKWSVSLRHLCLILFLNIRERGYWIEVVLRFLEGWEG